MKYLGKKSLSSLLSKILHVSWYVLLISSIIAVVIGVLFLLSMSCKENTAPEIANFSCNTFSIDANDPDWKEFQNLPLGIKFFLLPYFGIVVALLLQIIKKSRHLFDNFKNDIVFSRNNVLLISKIAKLLIAFSIITFDFSSLLVSIILLIVCDIIKNGTTLQEEHDLTV